MVLSHMAKADGYMVRFFLEFCMGLAFCPSVFEFSSFGFILLPFLGAFICEVVGGDFEACFCCCVLSSF